MFHIIVTTDQPISRLDAHHPALHIEAKIVPSALTVISKVKVKRPHFNKMQLVWCKIAIEQLSRSKILSPSNMD